MKQIFLAPRSNETAYQHYISSMQGRPRAQVTPYLTEEESKQLLNNDKFFIWGCQPSMEARWQKLQLGDYILFYAKGKFIAVGELLFKKKSDALAKSLWPVNEETNEPWSCVFFVDNLQTIALPIKDFAEVTGYNIDRVQGFMPVVTAMPQIIDKYGTVDNFIETIKSGLNPNDLEELTQYSRITPSQLSAEDKERIDEITRGKDEKELEAALARYAEAALGSTPEQVTRTVTSLRRNRNLVNDLKAKFGNKCQICEFTFKTATGKYYSEAAHIIPISSRQEGVDSPDNIWVLCPNHHKMLDTGALKSVSATQYELDGEEYELKIV